MIGNKKLGYVYCCPGKTGTASVRGWLRSRYHGIEIAEYHDMDVPLDYQGLFTFITVRNPYERLYSLWYFTNKNGKGRRARGWSFIYSVEDYKAQGHALADEYRQCGATQFLRVEKLSKEVTKLPFFRDGAVPGHVRRNAKKPHASFFGEFERGSPEQLAVARLFAEDFEQFGYQV